MQLSGRKIVFSVTSVLAVVCLNNHNTKSLLKNVNLKKKSEKKLR